MGTEKTRLTISVPDDVDEVLQELSDLLKTPKSALIASVLDANLSSLKKTLWLLKKGVPSEKGVMAGILALLTKKEKSDVR